MDVQLVPMITNAVVVALATLLLTYVLRDKFRAVEARMGRFEIDLHALRTEVGGLRLEMHTEIGALRTEMHTEIGALRSELRTEIGALRIEVSTEFASVRSEIAAVRGDLTAIALEVGARPHRPAS